MAKFCRIAGVPAASSLACGRKRPHVDSQACSAQPLVAQADPCLVEVPGRRSYGNRLVAVTGAWAAGEEGRRPVPRSPAYRPLGSWKTEAAALGHHDHMTLDDLTAAMRRFDDAVQQRDHAAAEESLDEDFALVLVHPSPALMPRARWLQVLDDYVVHSYAIEEQHVDQVDDVAAVLSRVQMQATVLGEDRSGLFVLSDVWRRQNGGWRVWRRHSSPLSAGDLPGAQSP